MMPRIIASRDHEIAIGHRVVGHEGKCRHLHGHNLKCSFHCEAAVLDEVGRVLDFAKIKDLANWLEEHWDHRMLLWEKDPLLPDIRKLDPSVVSVPFNPTSENMAQHLLGVVGPMVLPMGVTLTGVDVWETGKCRARAELWTFATTEEVKPAPRTRG